MSVEEAKDSDALRAFCETMTGDKVAIIPLYGEAAKDLEMPEWPVIVGKDREEMLDGVKDKVDKRMGMILDGVLESVGIKKKGQ